MTASPPAPIWKLERHLLTAGALLVLTFVASFRLDWLTHLEAVPGGPGAATEGVKVDVLDLALSLATLRLLWPLRQALPQTGAQPIRGLWWLLVAVAVWRLLASVKMVLPLG